MRIETSPFEIDKAQMIHVLYVVSAMEHGEQIIRDAADSDAPGLLLRRDRTEEGEVSILSLPARRLAVVVASELVPSLAVEQMLVASASEILAAGGRLDVFDLR